MYPARKNRFVLSSANPGKDKRVLSPVEAEDREEPESEVVDSLPPPTPVVTAADHHTQLPELPPVTMTHFCLEKIDAVKEGVNFIALALVDKFPDEFQHPLLKRSSKRSKRHVHAQKRCIDAGIGLVIEIIEFAGVEFLLIRKTYLSYLMKPIPDPVPPQGIRDETSTTATQVIVNGLIFSVIVVDGCDYCLAVYDGKKLDSQYQFSLDQTGHADILKLTISKLPLYCHNCGEDGKFCASCDAQIVSHARDVHLSNLQSGKELWRGNWGEVWAAAWCVASPAGVFNLSDPKRLIVAYKRILNVMESPFSVVAHGSKDYFFFKHAIHAKSRIHKRGERNPYLIINSHGLRPCFEERSSRYADNQLREAEIMQYLGGLPDQFVQLKAFGIDEYNLYMISELLPCVSLDKLLMRLPHERVSLSVVKHIMQRLFELVFILHELSIAHCDIKVDNVAFRLRPRYDSDAALRARVSPLSSSSASQIEEGDLLGLLAVLIDFGQAKWQPLPAPPAVSPTTVASANPPVPPNASTDPLKMQKHKDLHRLGRIMFRLVVGANLKSDIPVEYIADVCNSLRDARLLSDEGATLLYNLLVNVDCTAAAVLKHEW